MYRRYIDELCTIHLLYKKLQTKTNTFYVRVDYTEIIVKVVLWCTTPTIRYLFLKVFLVRERHKDLSHFVKSLSVLFKPSRVFPDGRKNLIYNISTKYCLQNIFHLISPLRVDTYYRFNGFLKFFGYLVKGNETWKT